MLRRLLSLALMAPLLLSACVSGFAPSGTARSAPLNAERYKTDKDSKAVVLMAINWARRWNCGGYDNAQLRMLAFDRLPINHPQADAAADLAIEGPPTLLTRPRFSNYALVVEPGEYALSGFDIKLAQSAKEVGHTRANRTHLIKEGKPLAGSFMAKPGQIVYIGNFWIDCTDPRMPWRFYTEEEAWLSHLSEYQQQYPFLDTGVVVYNLFKTSVIGWPYELQSP